MVTRREFLKGLGALAVAPAVLAVLPEEKPKTATEIKWRYYDKLRTFRTEGIEPNVAYVNDRMYDQLANMYAEMHSEGLRDVAMLSGIKW
jgi:hypothetical protein